MSIFHVIDKIIQSGKGPVTLLALVRLGAIIFMDFLMALEASGIEKMAAAATARKLGRVPVLI